MPTLRVNNPQVAINAWAYVELTLNTHLSRNALPICDKLFGTDSIEETAFVFCDQAGVITFTIAVLKADMVLDAKRDHAAHPNKPVTFDAAEFDYACSTSGKIVIENRDLDRAVRRYQ